MLSENVGNDSTCQKMIMIYMREENENENKEKLCRHPLQMEGSSAGVEQEVSSYMKALNYTSCQPVCASLMSRDSSQWRQCCGNVSGAR